MLLLNEALYFLVLIDKFSDAKVYYHQIKGKSHFFYKMWLFPLILSSASAILKNENCYNILRRLYNERNHLFRNVY